MEQRGLSYLDMTALCEQLAERCRHLLAVGGGHLLDAGSLRSMAIAHLMDQGVNAHELAVDHRHGRIHPDLWIALDAGINHTLLFTHPTTRPDEQRLITRTRATLSIPAHEHFTVALLASAAPATWWGSWPLRIDAEGIIGEQLRATCIAASAAGPHHQVVVWSCPPPQEQIPDSQQAPLFSLRPTGPAA